MLVLTKALETAGHTLIINLDVVNMVIPTLQIVKQLEMVENLSATQHLLAIQHLLLPGNIIENLYKHFLVQERLKNT